MKQTTTAPERRHLAFTHNDRTFTCVVGPRHQKESTLWWWFSVSGGNNSRYAPFVAEPDDTDESVQDRILTYYEAHKAPRVFQYRGQRS